MNLLDEWSAWQTESAPFILAADREVLTARRCIDRLITFTSWAQACGDADFGRPGDKRLHVGLLPHPFCGDLRNAAVYILLLNPGLGPHDYFGEFEVPAFRAAVINNLKQQFPIGSIPFFLLDPQFSWHGGYGWWHSKLGGVIERLKDVWQLSFAAARAKLGSFVASIELVPYHSAGFHDAGGWVRQLYSAALARSFVSDVVVPRVAAGEAIVVVTRQTSAWNLPDRAGIVKYSSSEARAAHLSPDSRGGRAILNQLEKLHGRSAADRA